jgi:predicted metal-dependent hydrolase
MPEYELKESARAKYVRIQVDANGEVVVTKPKRASLRSVEQFVKARATWIEEAKRKASKRRGGLPLIPLARPRKGSRAYEEARKAARLLASERLAYFNTLYKTMYGAISIRDQKTRWGSCSHRNNLSFNYRIAFLPSGLADYIIVHELCHTIEHNHSPRFWAQVARALPNHEALRKEIRTRYQL